MNLLIPCAPGCCAPANCEVFIDYFDRSFLNILSPVTYTGNTSSFSISSGALTCTTSDKYIVASGLGNFSNGQIFAAFILSSSSGTTDLIVNWRDTNNYDFVRIPSASAPLSIYQRTSGSDSLLASYHTNVFSSGGSILIARWDDRLALLSGFNTSWEYMVAIGMNTFVSSSTVGMRLNSGTLSIDSVNAFQYGGGCPEFDTRCLDCTIDDTESVQLELTMTGATGDATALNGANTLDFYSPNDGRALFQYDLPGTYTILNNDRSCLWRYQSSPVQLTVNIRGKLSASGDNYLSATLLHTTNGANATYLKDPLATDRLPCTNATYTLDLQTGSGGSTWPSTITVEVL